MTADQYAWWRQALKLAGGYRELTHDQLLLLAPSADSPESGFFRNRPYKDAPLVPVAIWRDASGKVNCLQGDKEAEADKVWNYACRNPITETLYHSVLAGGAWPDEPPSVAKDHNLPAKTGDLHKDLAAELSAEKETVEGFLKKAIATQEQADQAGVWAKRLAGIATKADEQFNVEKRPWLDGGNAVDDKWRDVRTDAKELAKKLKKHGEAWLKELDRLEQERQRKAREEADRIRREAEAAAQRMADAARAAEEESARRNAIATPPGLAASFEQESQQEANLIEAEAEAKRLIQRVADADREAQARPVFSGRTGAKVSLHTFWVANITDYDALVAALKDEPEVREAVEKIAGRIARNKDAILPAGMDRIPDKRAA
ncbi:hypothetical protein [Mesorhizobium sp. M7A.F.Ca.MR.148.00.0.0]|uniref:hypothetical protein n=1 Tax=Mesorhizobium sp. M7A.F.Ca.MR.148.00.0.0 TaxID=2496775 RepID=UPI000FCBB92C|nr:hypothetical protein [Mesorhizobium sp. M7A.F.Ca.MR.148.00.0.0]RUV37458.1 hypothetical protein EOB49_11910 [Mesorhizobium sp. M7A.F.Ca.MR.148.00.0.0]